MEKSKEIFGNKISQKDYSKAVKGQKKLIKKFGDDRNSDYHLGLSNNDVLDGLNTKLLVKSDKKLDLSEIKNPIVIGNIRMGFGHYRISMAMCSCAKALGYTPLWFDLNSFYDTTCGKIINYQNELYSLGSRLSQKFSLFNKLFWEPLNSEGFRQLSYNACDQKNAELITTVYQDLDKSLPFVATHVWPSQGAIHSGMTNVVNAIPDNWQMALHLSEGAVHTVQTHSALLGYTELRGMDKDKILKPMPENSIFYTGHYVDDELVSNIEMDTGKRIDRVQNDKPLRFLLTVGGAGAQSELFVAIIKKLLPYIKAKKAVLFVNFGDHKNVYEEISNKISEIKNSTMHSDFAEIKQFANTAITSEVEGIHSFLSDDIFVAVYSTNLLMRASDILATKPSELAFYPVPKLMIKRVGGHEAYGAIHASEIGDGTYEIDEIDKIDSFIDLVFTNKLILTNMNVAIIKNKMIGVYNGGYEVIKLATEKI